MLRKRLKSRALEAGVGALVGGVGGALTDSQGDVVGGGLTGAALGAGAAVGGSHLVRNFKASRFARNQSSKGLKSSFEGQKFKGDAVKNRINKLQGVLNKHNSDNFPSSREFRKNIEKEIFHHKKNKAKMFDKAKKERMRMLGSRAFGRG